MNEIWKDIYYTDNRTGKVVDFRNHYQVSNFGRVRSLKQGKEFIMKIRLNNKQRRYVRLSKNGITKMFQVHRLVAFMFVINDDPLNKIEVDHIIPISNGGGDESNNLRWVTHLENMNNPISLKNRSGVNNPLYNMCGSKSIHSKAVVGVDKVNGKIIEYESMGMAELDGFNSRTISDCCQQNLIGVEEFVKKHGRKRNEHKGYFWYYKEDFENKFNRVEETE